MAILSNNFLGPFSGKYAGCVVYLLNGQMIMRSIGTTNKKPTLKQLTHRGKVALTNLFLKLIHDFISVGFELEARGTTSNTFNKAFGANVKNIVSGDYGNQQLDFSKALVAKGDYPMLNNVKVAAVDKGLEFTWDKESKGGTAYWRDQIMFLACSSDLKYAYSNKAGAVRSSGRNTLPLPAGKKMGFHIYIAVMADNRKSVSNSLYLGQIIWGN